LFVHKFEKLKIKKFLLNTSKTCKWKNSRNFKKCCEWSKWFRSIKWKNKKKRCWKI